nr:exodeoxyribonuclease V subunit gamma [uncultured Rhodoferax sp.]
MLKNQETTFPPGFMVLHGNRLEDLRDLLTQVLQANPLRPLEPEVILLQSNGMKHWLELALADDAALGICAATRMELPGGYLWQLYRAVLGADAVPAHMPFDKTSLLWRLVRLLPALCDSQPVYAPLKRYLSGSNPARKLYQLAVQVADVIDGYQSYRADWLADWADGQDQLRDEKGQAQPLLDDHAWQAQLWRDIRTDVGEALMEASRASVHARFMTALEDLKNSQNESALRRCGLPHRLIVFGISSLPMQTVQALAGLGQHCQVLMLVQNPCQYFWGDLVEGHDRLRQQVRRRQPVKPLDAAALMPPASHPLLASWGKQGRDYLHLLDGFDEPEQYRAHWSRVDVFVDPAADGVQPTQLAQLQSAMLNLSPPPPEPQPQPDDGSLVFVTAHSAQRELEVLHDRLLAWLDADPSLLPRDVMVMVPDMPAFAPHIHAVFGRFRPGQPRFIPFSVADTTARTSPLVQALEQLLNLPTSRLSLADWLGLFEVAAVRQRFKLDEAGVDQIQTWLAAAGVRWGLDAAHRIQWGLPAEAEGLAQNTWAFGLRRLLLGYALGANADEPAALWQDTLAQPALSSLDAPLAAGLLDWLDAVERTLPSLQQDQTPAQWGATLQALVSRFFAPADDADERALARLLEPLDAWLQACADAQLNTTLPLEVVREHWLAQMQDSGLQQRFFGGGVQFGTLMPMRSIPFKVIALLGMNDGAYPRVQAARDFDLMASSWRAGDRSRREDDRYLFLEAILSAREKLYVSWQGHSASDNSPRPPSVLVAQLLDYVNTCWSPHREPQAQPLQPFSSVYFEAGSGFETYDADWERIQPVAKVEPAQAAIEGIADEASFPLPRGEGQGEGEFQVVRVVGASDKGGPHPSPLPEGEGAIPNTHLTLADLQRLLRQPVEVFFRNRLQLEFDSLDELDQTDEPFALNALQQHNAGVALLQSASGAQALQQLHGAGQLPLAGFGQQLAQQLLTKAEHVRSAQALWLQRYSQPLAAQPVDLTLAGGINLSGTLANLWSQPEAADGQPGPCLQLAARTGAVLQGSKNATAARGHVLVNLWVNHLGACASGLALTSVQLGVDGQVVIRPIAQDEALATLNRLAQAYASAWANPLPVACQTAWAYLQAEKQNLLRAQAGKPTKDPHEAAEDTFEGGQYGGELAQSAYLQRAFEGYADLAAELPHWAKVIYGDLADSVDVSQAG